MSAEKIIKKNIPIEGSKLIGNIGKLKIYEYPTIKLTDIEDLFEKGKNNCFCPYFYNIRKTKEYANLTFMSYHYILNPFIREKCFRLLK